MRRMIRVVSSLFLFACLLAPAARAERRIVLSAQLGLVPWKGVGHIHGESERAAFDKFLAAHPEADVQEFDRLWLPGQAWGAAQVMSLAATAGPDLAYLDFPDLARYAREGLIQPIDDLCGNWDERDRWPESLVEGLKFEDKTWGIVSLAQHAVLAGNREALLSLGMTETSMPRTFAGIADVAAKLNVPGRRAGLGVVAGRPLAYLWLALARETGQDPVIVGKHGIEATLDSEPAKAAAEAIATLGAALRAGGATVLYVAPDALTLRKEFAAGKVGLALVSLADLDDHLGGTAGEIRDFAALQPLKPFLGPVPGVMAGSILGYTVGGQVLVLPSYIRDGVRRSLAFGFYTDATYAGSHIETEWLALLGQRAGWVRTDFLPRYPKHPALASFPPHWAGVLSQVTARARPMPPDPEFEELAIRLGERLTKVLQGTLEPGPALADAQQSFEEEIHLKTRRTSSKWTAIGWIVLAGFAALLGFGLWRLVAALRDEFSMLSRSTASAGGVRHWDIGLVLFAPAAILAIIFGVIPLLLGFKMSLSDHVLRGGGAFTGMRNYLDVIVTPTTLTVFLNTVYFLSLSFLLGFVAPFILSLALSSFPFGLTYVRTAFFMPAVASAVVIAILWQQMFDIGGPFNTLVHFLGFAERKWLAEPSTAMLAVVLPPAWATLGVAGLTYLAGLSAIPEALYEEAELSGAGLAERFRHVTWPHIKPLVGINLVGWAITATRTAEQVFLLTGGGPDNATYIVGVDIFTRAYVSIRFGYAMAEVWLLVAIILVFSIYQMRGVRSGQLQVTRE